MKKLLLFLGCLFFLVSCSQGDELIPSEENVTGNSQNYYMKQAQQRLQNIIKNHKFLTRSNGVNIKEAFPLQITRKVPSSSSQTRGNSLYQPADTIIDYAYVVNFDNEQGFIVMGAIDELPEIIAYSDNGNIPNPNGIEAVRINPYVQDFLTDLQLYVNYNCCTTVEDDGTNPILRKEYSPWEGRTLNGDGLCPVQWHQSYPYNKYCPFVNGSNVYAGCVTIAIAQLMACYKYPSAYSYKTTDKVISFDWDAMINDNYPLTGMTSSTEMICRLIESLFATENLAIHYITNDGSDASIGNIYRVPHTLSNFGYSKTGQEVLFATHETTAIEEIKDEHPILIYGNRNNNLSGIGHAWLVHGLYEQSRTVTYIWRNGNRTTKTETQYLFLCNWGGQNNSMNGYYWSTNFLPKENPDNTGITKPTEEEVGAFVGLKFLYNIRP